MKMAMSRFSVMLFLVMMILTGCSTGHMGLTPGRPLRIQGEPVQAEVLLGEEGSWARGQHPDTSCLDEATRKALAALWLNDARGEHASIPAFSRISWQLAMLGAPPQLLEWAHRAALEEINHARLCFALAEGYGGCSYSVQPVAAMLEGGIDFSNDPIDTMIKETIFDGCLIEGFFANIACAAVRQCQEAATLTALKQIADEEKSHAAFSWALLEWLLQQHPHQVKPQIQKAFHAIKHYSRPEAWNSEQRKLVEQANPELLIKHGRLLDTQWQEIWNHHLVETEQRLQRLLSCRQPFVDAPACCPEL